TGALVRYHAILEEDALQRIVSDPELLRTQAGRMIELVTEPDRVTIQLLPTSVGPIPVSRGRSPYWSSRRTRRRSPTWKPRRVGRSSRRRKRSTGANVSGHNCSTLRSHLGRRWRFCAG